MQGFKESCDDNPWHCSLVCFEVSEDSDSKQTSFHLYVKIDKVQDIFGNGRSFPIWGVFRQV